MGDGTERLGLATWTGSIWIDAGEYDSQTYNVNDTGQGDFQAAVSWLGTTGVAVCVYSDNQTGTLDWARWSPGAGWSIQPDVSVPGLGFVESAALTMLPASDRVMVVMLDSSSDLCAAIFGGLSWTLTNGAALLAMDVSAVDSMPFSTRFE